MYKEFMQHNQYLWRIDCTDQYIYWQQICFIFVTSNLNHLNYGSLDIIAVGCPTTKPFIYHISLVQLYDNFSSQSKFRMHQVSMLRQCMAKLLIMASQSGHFLILQNIDFFPLWLAIVKG